MAATTWNFDTSHSSIGFSVRHMMFAKVRGQFTKWEGTLTVDEQDPTKSSVTAKLDASSIATHDEKRDSHLASADFLDAGKYPSITFKSKKIVADGDGRSGAQPGPHLGDKLRITGDLTVRDVTREVTLDVERLGRAKDPWGNDRMAFSAKTTLDRTEFGLKWNQALEMGGVLVGEKVEVAIEVEVVAPATKS